MNSKIITLVGGAFLLPCFLFLAVQSNRLKNKDAYERKTGENLDAISTCASPSDYSLAAELVNRQADLTVNELQRHTIGRADRADLIHAWGQVAQVYRVQGRILGIDSQELEAGIAAAQEKVGAASGLQ